MNRKNLFKGIKRVVVKIGTNSIMTEKGRLDKAFLLEIARQVKQLNSLGIEVVIVSSGAIGNGMKELGLTVMPADVQMRQITASVGQPLLMAEYRAAFARHKKTVAQVLLTYNDFKDNKTFEMIKRSIVKLLKFGIIPIINENDAIAAEELGGKSFGDNDRLSAVLAIGIKAGLLVNLTSVAGLYSRHPAEGNARHVPVVKKVTARIKSMSNGKSVLGAGGMKSKVEAAEMCVKNSLYFVIASHAEKNVLTRIVKGEKLGTIFFPNKGD